MSISLKDLIKRTFAAALAIITVLFTMSDTLESIVYASGGYTLETTSSLQSAGDATYSINSGNSIAEVYTSSSTYEKLNSATMYVDYSAGQTITYTVSVYQNLSSASNPTSGVLRYTSEEQTFVSSAAEAMEKQALTYDFSGLSTPIYISSGETVSVVFTFTLTGTTSMYFYTESQKTSSVAAWYNKNGSWSGLNTVMSISCDDITSISSDVEISSVYIGDTAVETTTEKDGTIPTVYIDRNASSFNITATISPALKRSISYESVSATGASTNAVDVTTAGVATVGATGTSTVTVTAGGTSVYFNITVLESSFTDASNGSLTCTYNGSEQEPSITITDGTNTYESKDGDFDSKFTVEYKDNEDATTSATATISGTGDFASYSKTLTFTIEPAAISETDVTNGSYTIDGDGNVTSSTVGNLSSSDYTVSATRSGASATDGTITYTVTVTGQNNYTGSYSTTKTVNIDSSNVIDIEDVVDAALDSSKSTYDGSAKTPSISFYTAGTYGTEDESQITFTSYTYTYFKDGVEVSSMVDAGEYQVAITGSGNGYTGTIYLDYTIEQLAISDGQITVNFDDDDSVYGSGTYYIVHTGSALKPTVTLIMNNKKLSLGTDYKVEYEDNMDVGTMWLKITALSDSNYTGSRSVSVKIVNDFETDAYVSIGGSSAKVSSKVATTSYKTYYTGSEIEPSVVVYFSSSNDPVSTDDYSVTWSENIEAGTATATITGKNTYDGKEITATFTIEARPLSTDTTFTIAANARTFCFEDITLESSEYDLYRGETPLVEGTDYEIIEYQNNYDAGTATIIAEGKGNYSGTLEQTFTISALSVTELTIELEKPTYSYTGSAVEPTFTVYYNDEIVGTSAGYTYKYTDNIDVGQATLTLIGNNNLTGETSTTFQIVAVDAADLTFTVGNSTVEVEYDSELETYVGTSTYSATYTGSAIEPSVKVTDKNDKTVSTDYYTIESYSDNVNVGSEAYVHIVGVEGTNYEAVDVIIYFSITARSIGDTSYVNIVQGDKSTVSTDYVGTDDEGNEFNYGMPSITVYKAGTSKLLTEGTDYYIEITDSCKVAGSNCTLYVKGMGNYTGSYTITFEIGTKLSSLLYTTGSTYTYNTSGLSKIAYIGENRPDIGIPGISSSEYTCIYTPENSYDVTGNAVQVTFNAISTSLECYGSVTWSYTLVEADLTGATSCCVSSENNKVTATNFTINGINTASSVALTGDYTGDYIDLTDTENLEVLYNFNDTSLDPIQLTYGVDYTLSVEAVKEQGTYNIVVEGIGNYTGKVYITYTVSQVSLQNTERITVVSDETCTYTGQIVLPGFTITDSIRGELTLGEDFQIESITAGNNINVGNWSIVVSGINNYKDSYTIYYTIEAQELSEDDSNISISEIGNQTYEGSAVTVDSLFENGTYTITYGEDTELTYGVDYELSYENNEAPGEATLIITGKGNYEGTLTTTFNIVADIANENYFTISNVEDEYTLIVSGSTASIDVSAITVETTDGSLTLTKGKDYSVTLESCDTPGIGKITVAGCSDYYGGSKEYTVTVYADLADAVISMSSTTYDYTGGEVTPEFTVTYCGTELVAGSDYTYEYSNNLAVSDTGASVKITAKGTYYINSKTLYFYIKYNLATATITGVESSYSYTGYAITPTITVTCAGTSDNPVTLTEGVHYNVTYGSNTNTGTGTVTISTVDEASGIVMNSQTKTFAINQVEIGTVTVVFSDTGEDQPDDYTYTGSAIKPTPTLKINTGSTVYTLVAGTDYTISYLDNTDVGVASVVITAYGNFYGTLTKTFNITACPISNATITVSDVYYAGGKQVTPTMSLTYKGMTLVEGTDFTYTLTDSCQVSTGDNHETITFYGRGNYSSSTSVDYVVKENNLSTGTVSIATSEATYTGSVIDPKITVVCPLGNGELATLVEGEHYTVTYSDQILNASTYQITITAVANSGFTGSVVKTFTVKPKSITSDDITITGVEDKAYTGSAVTQSITVYDETRDVELVLNQDYTISYSNNKASASKDDETAAPTVIVTGINNYGDSYSETFNIGNSLEDAVVTLSLGDSVYTYNGTVQHPTITSVKLNNVSLTEGIDFTEVVNTTANYYVDAGSKTITIKGTGGYYGTATATYQIQKRSTDSIRIVLNDLDEDDGTYYATYDGKAITPSVTVYDDSLSTVSPISEDEYTITYVHNDLVSSAGNNALVQVTFTKNYVSNTKIQEFVIEAAEMTSDDLTMTLWCDGELQSVWAYTGYAVKPDVIIYYINADGEKITLTKNTDYDLSYSDNKNAGVATVTATLKGNYSGTISKTFTIVADLSTAKIAAIADQFYTGSAIIPSLTVTCGGNTLTVDEDYIVTAYSDDNFVSSGKVIITAATGADYYTGTNTASYNIVFSADALTVTGVANEYTYTGKAIEPEVKVVTPSGEVISSTVTYIGDHTNVGTANMEITVTVGSQTITFEESFDIVSRAISTCTTTYLETMTYTGSALTPPVYLVYNGVQLVEGTDFTVSISNNTNPGTGTITVTGIGNFTGTNKLQFNIISANMKSLTGSPETTTSVLLSWNSRVEVTGFEIYSEDGKTKYGTTTGSSFSVTDLDPSTEYTFKVRSYVTVGGTTTYGAFTSVTTNTKVEAVTLSTSSTSSGKVSVSWSENSTVTGYEIYRATSSSGTYTKIASVPSGYTGYSDTSVTSGQTYYYKIRGYVVFSSGTIQYGTYSKTISVTAK